MADPIAVKTTTLPSDTTENVPCDQCECFTIDYKFHTGARIRLDGRAAHRPSYGNSNRYFFALSWFRKDIWPELPGLRASRLRGCDLCGVLRAKIIADKSVQPPDPSPATAEISIKAEFGFQEPWQRKPTGVVFLSQLTGQATWSPIGLQPTFILAASRDTAASRQFRNIPAAEGLSLENVGTMKDWIRECGENHHYCQPRTAQLLPTRLIDVEQRDPRLVVTQGQIGRYATLSYCWGISPHNPYDSMYITTKATQDARMRGMTLEELPNTLRDAVLVTRAFGLKYLWIDALCIIQDSQADIESEIERMSSVYGNCEITIGATSATSSKSGFLTRRAPPQPLVKMPFVPCEGGRKASYGFFDTASFPEWTKWTGVESSEWNQRAWTFQERIISPRVLHFDFECTYFECRTSDSTELGCPSRQTIAPQNMFGTDYRYLGAVQFLASQNPRNIAEIYGYYYRLACQYSKRVLTSEADREDAFAAIVEQFEHDLNVSEYLCGIWTADLWHGLGWTIWGRRENSPETETDRRRRVQLEKVGKWPSWSWYSCPHPIDWRHRGRPLPHDSTAHRSSPTLRSVVAAEGGIPARLIIVAVLCAAKIKITTPYRPNKTAVLVVGGDEGGSVDLDGRSDLNEEGKDDWEEEGKEGGKEVLLSGVWLLLLANEQHDNAYGLIVKAAGREAYYKRIGYFELREREFEKMLGSLERTVITLV